MNSDQQEAQPNASLLIASVAAATTVSWGCFFYSFSLFLGPLNEAFGFSRVTMTAALSLGILIMGCAAPFVGRLIDQTGGRNVLVGGALVGSFGFIILASMNHIAMLFIGYALLGLAMAATLYEASFAVLYVALQERAKRAIIVAALVGGFASTIFMPITLWLIQWLGWRGAYAALALITLLLSAGLPALILGQLKGQAKSMEQNNARSTALKKPQFWLLLVFVCSVSFLTSALSFHQVPLLEERGITTARAVAAIAMIGPMQVVGRLAMMPLDRWSGLRGTGLVSALTAFLALLFLMMVTADNIWLLIYPVFWGFGYGMTSIIRALAVPEYLSKRNYGSINGMLGFGAALAMASAPIAVSLIWSINQSYDAVLMLLATLCLVGFGCFLTVSFMKTPFHEITPSPDASTSSAAR